MGNIVPFKEQWQKKVKEPQLLRTRCLSVCADGASAMMRAKNVYEFMEKENKNVQVVIASFTERNSGGGRYLRFNIIVSKYISSTVYDRGSQPGVHVPLGVHLPIRRGTSDVSNRREICIYISFISKYLYIYQ